MVYKNECKRIKIKRKPNIINIKRIKDFVFLFTIIKIFQISLTKSSFIELEISGSENAKLYLSKADVSEYCKDIITPDEIIINGAQKAKNDDATYPMGQGKNTVKLTWHDDNEIKNLNCFFVNCDKITYIDLSHFDSSLVNSTNDMFNGCHSLESINFGNFSTEKVVDMHWIFYGCIKL